MKTHFARRPLISALLAISAISVAQAAPVTYTPLHDSLRRRAISTYNAHDYAGAEALDTQAIEADFTDPYAWASRSGSREALGNKDDAFRDNSTFIIAKQVQGLNEEDQDVFNMELAAAHLRNAKYWFKKDEMLRAYVESVVAVEADKTHGAGLYPDPWVMRADVNYALGDFDQAQTCLQYAQNIDPKIVRSFTKEEARQNALKHRPFQLTADLNPQLDAARAADQSGDRKEAYRILNSLIEIRPLGPLHTDEVFAPTI